MSCKSVIISKVLGLIVAISLLSTPIVGSVEPAKVRDNKTLTSSPLTFLPLTVKTFASYRQSKGSNLSSLLLTAALPIATSSSPEEMASIACDQHDVCLIVWEANDDIKGRMVPAYARQDQLGGEFSIGPISGQQNNPVVAYNPERDEFLIVFENGAPSTLMAQKIDSMGIPSLHSLEVSGRDAAVTYLPITGDYLIAYRHTGDGEDDIALLQFDGINPPTNAFVANNPNVQESTPHLVFNGDSTFVVWVEKSAPSYSPSIHGCWFDVEATQCIATPELISNPGVSADWPDVTYSSIANHLLVVWWQNYHIYGRIYKKDMGSYAGETPFVIGDVMDVNPAHPKAIVSPYDDVFLVAWDRNDTNDALVGQYLSSDGNFVDDEGRLINASSPTLLAAHTTMGVPASEQPGIGFNLAAGHFVVSWTDDGNNEDIYAQYVRSTSAHDWPVLTSRDSEGEPTI